MPEHLTTLQFENLSARWLLPGELVAATRHLAACTDCRQRVQVQAKMGERVAALQSALRTEAGGAHLSYEQLVTYVENKADVIEREILLNHLDACQPCTREAQELQALHDSLAKPSPPRQTFVEWLRSAWQVPTFLHPLPLSAVAVLLLITAVWWLQKPAPGPQIAVTRPSPVGTPALAIPPSPLPAARPAVVAALLDNGRQIALDETGNVTGLAALSKDAERALKQALATQQIETPAELKALRQRPATLMSGAEEQSALKLQSPVATFVKDTQPTFRWHAVQGAQGYTVQVLDEQFNIVATSPALTQPFWRATPSLKRGQEYVWQVTAEVDGKRVTSASASTPEAHFKILGAGKARALQTTIQHHPSHLLRGTIYAQAGLLDEAEREYQALLRANPHSVIARKLLQHLRAVR